jgi:hypothetical protein
MTVPQNNVSWRKPTQSGDQGSCFELRNDLRAVRDSKDPDGGFLTVDLAAFIRAVKARS